MSQESINTASTGETRQIATANCSKPAAEIKYATAGALRRYCADGSTHINGQEAAGELVDISDILPEDYKGPTKIAVPKYSFKPDGWTKALLQGLKKLDVEGKKGIELGLGTGANLIYLLNARNPERIFGSDKDDRLATLAVENVLRTVPRDRAQKFSPCYGARDLAQWFKKRESLDFAYGCLPQATPRPGTDITSGDGSAHYYDPKKYPSEFNPWKLGLNHHALLQLHSILKPGGQAVLNFSGRVGLDPLQKLYQASGFKHSVLHSEVVPQHAETELDPFIETEQATGQPCDFFTDPEAIHHIGAEEAEKRRVEGESVYHYIYVLTGTKV